jgi:hypothetical protein
MFPLASCFVPRKARRESSVGSPTVARKPSHGVNKVRAIDVSVVVWAAAMHEKTAVLAAMSNRDMRAIAADRVLLPGKAVGINFMRVLP